MSIILADERNKLLKQEMLNVLSPYNANQSLETLLLKGICDSIAHHTIQRGNSRMLASEMFIKNVCCACMFELEKVIGGGSGKQITKIIGISFLSNGKSTYQG